MEDEKDKPQADANDDSYVIEDTGESLEEFSEVLQQSGEEGLVEEVPVATGTDVLDENRRLRDQLMRKLADFENFRKRTDREKQDYFKYALADTIRGLLPVLDNFDRALEHANTEEDDFHRGVAMIHKQLSETLQKWGVTVVDQPGVHFDPTIHEAVMREEDSSVPSHTVVEILQKGYFLNDRLIRPALVKVSMGGAEVPREDV